ncbi:protein-tyrosine phosphatase family protein [Streptomyces sp. NPDC020412]|uniref:protein-tyrosine phosphatase family protein n=1 Tax=Streptomyces sp. NPDC020412 TaxID=3365073 RepID=UPI0037B1197C
MHTGVSGTWEAETPGVLRLPSGRLVRGRGLRHGPVEGPEPGLGVYLLGEEPPVVPWESQWVPWPDFRLPRDRAGARETLRIAWERAERERVEVACHGGRGRTGTALACMAVLDGVEPGEAVAYVRRHYDRRAVETPWQKRYVRRFGSELAG